MTDLQIYVVCGLGVLACMALIALVLNAADWFPDDLP